MEWLENVKGKNLRGRYFASFTLYVTERRISKLAINHANIISKQQTVGKISDHELLSPENFGSGWDKVFLAQKY